MRAFHPQMNMLASRYGTQVRIVFVYILEAHAKDEWYVSSINEELSQHKSTSDRVEAANVFTAKYPLHAQIELVLDNEDNDFNETYSSWPFRYWMIDCDGKIALKCMPVGDKVSLDCLENRLSMQFPDC